MGLRQCKSHVQTGGWYREGREESRGAEESSKGAARFGEGTAAQVWGVNVTHLILSLIWFGCTCNCSVRLFVCTNKTWSKGSKFGGDVLLVYMQNGQMDVCSSFPIYIDGDIQGAVLTLLFVIAEFI